MTPEAQRQFKRLMAIADEHAAEVKADPDRFIRKIADQYAALRGEVERALLSLKGLDDFDFAQELAPHIPPERIEGLAIVRNNKAAARLKAALKRQPFDNEETG